MIRRLIDALLTGRTAEIAELRDRAVRDAQVIAGAHQHIDRLESENARLIAELDQGDAALRNARNLLQGAGHATTVKPCPICQLVADINNHLNHSKETR